MSRLPTPGGDEGNWGEILNQYLSASHNSDGTIKSSSLAEAGALMAANNLSDLPNPEAAKTNIGVTGDNSGGGGGAPINNHRVVKYINAGSISGIEENWNPAGWDGGAGDVDVLMADPTLATPGSWQPNSFYTTLAGYGLFQSMIYEADSAWIATPSKGFTGEVEPSYNSLAVDGSIVYSRGITYYEWNPNTYFYSLYTHVYKNGFLWRADNEGETGVTEPTWTGTEVNDGNISWIRIGRVIEWEPELELTIDPGTSYGSSPAFGWMKFSNNDDRYLFLATSMSRAVRSGSTKPDFSSSVMTSTPVFDNDILWLEYTPAKLGDSYMVMPHLLSLDASNAVDGRKVTIHFSGDIYGLTMQRGSFLGDGFGSSSGDGLADPNYMAETYFSDGYNGSGSGGSISGLVTQGKPYMVTVGLASYDQAMKPGYIEGSYIYSKGSIELMWDATAEIWRILSGGNESATQIDSGTKGTLHSLIGW